MGLHRQRTNISRKDWNNFYKEIGSCTVGQLILQTPVEKYPTGLIFLIYIAPDSHTVLLYIFQGQLLP
jgi:hypothetical protein